MHHVKKEVGISSKVKTNAWIIFKVNHSVLHTYEKGLINGPTSATTTGTVHQIHPCSHPSIFTLWIMKLDMSLECQWYLFKENRTQYSILGKDLWSIYLVLIVLMCN